MSEACVYNYICISRRLNTESAMHETYVDKGSGDDNARTKLLEKGKDEREVPAHGPLQEQRPEDTESTRSHNSKQKADAQADVVVALGGIALGCL